MRALSLLSPRLYYPQAVLVFLLFARAVNADPTNCVSPPSGLVGWWRFENNGADDTLHNPGVLVGNPGFVSGEVGLAMDSPGQRVGLVVSNSASLNFRSGDFSVEAWIRPVVATTTYGIMDIVDKRLTPDLTHALGYQYGLLNGQLAFQMCDSLSRAPLIVGPAGPDLRDGQWHHVAVSVQRLAPDGGRLYVDGVLILTFDPTGYPGSLTSSAPLLIGLHPGYPTFDSDFRGGIDEVSVYSRALSDADVQAVFGAGSAGKCSVNPPILSVAIYAGLTIEGAVGHTYDVQYTTNMGQRDWLPLASVTLTEQVQLWFDTNSVQQPKRFYRAVAVP